jgi:hypothetical protein
MAAEQVQFKNSLAEFVQKYAAIETAQFCCNLMHQYTHGKIVNDMIGRDRSQVTGQKHTNLTLYDLLRKTSFANSGLIGAHDLEISIANDWMYFLNEGQIDTKKLLGSPRQLGDFYIANMESADYYDRERMGPNVINIVKRHFICNGTMDVNAENAVFDVVFQNYQMPVFCDLTQLLSSELNMELGSNEQYDLGKVEQEVVNAEILKIGKLLLAKDIEDNTNAVDAFARLWETISHSNYQLHPIAQMEFASMIIITALKEEGIKERTIGILKKMLLISIANLVVFLSEIYGRSQEFDFSDFSPALPKYDQMMKAGNRRTSDVLKYVSNDGEYEDFKKFIDELLTDEEPQFTFRRSKRERFIHYPFADSSDKKIVLSNRNVLPLLWEIFEHMRNTVGLAFDEYAQYFFNSEQPIYEITDAKLTADEYFKKISDLWIFLDSNHQIRKNKNNYLNLFAMVMDGFNSNSFSRTLLSRTKTYYEECLLRMLKTYLKQWSGSCFSTGFFDPLDNVANGIMSAIRWVSNYSIKSVIAVPYTGKKEDNFVNVDYYSIHTTDKSSPVYSNRLNLEEIIREAVDAWGICEGKKSCKILGTEEKGSFLWIQQGIR